LVTKSVRFTKGRVSIHHLQYLMKGRGVETNYLPHAGNVFLLTMSARDENSIVAAIEQAKTLGFTDEGEN